MQSIFQPRLSYTMVFISLYVGERYKLVDVDMATGDQDDEKDDFYGCSCQRYLCVGLIMPFLLFVAFLGFMFHKMSKLRMFFLIIFKFIFRTED